MRFFGLSNQPLPAEVPRARAGEQAQIQNHSWQIINFFSSILRSVETTSAMCAMILPPVPLPHQVLFTSFFNSHSCTLKMSQNLPLDL